MLELFYEIPFLIFLSALLFHIITTVPLFRRLAFYKSKKEPTDTYPPVSVIISAKNEEENLTQHLPSILEQDYPDFEVIVVNDQSEDETDTVLRDLSKKYKNLKLVKVEPHIKEYPGKKFALTLGIRKSQYEILLFTDADCKPLTNQWIKSIARNYSDEKEIVLGYSPYQRKNSILNLFICFDTFYTALLYFSFALAGKGYMGVGRNLSYRKNLFYKSGFASHLHIPSGDDDLFVNENATKNNIAIEIDPASFVVSIPKKKSQQWYQQKIRHLKSGKEYKKRDKSRLGWIWLGHFTFYISFLVAILLNPFNYLILAVFGLKVILTLILYGLTLNKFKLRILIWFVPILDIIYHIILIPLISIVSLSRKNKNVW